MGQCQISYSSLGPPCINRVLSKICQNYASIAYSLTELLEKGAFNWSEEAQLSFDASKQAMTATPVLALPDFTALHYAR